MRKYSRKMKMVLLLLAMVFTTGSPLPVIKAEAAVNPSFPTEINVTYETSKNASNVTGYLIDHFPKNGKVKNLKSL